MPKPPIPEWPRCIWFIATGRKPHKARLPGLVIGPTGTYADGRKTWRCYFEGLLSN